MRTLDLRVIFETALAVVGSLGGGALVGTGFSNYLGKLWADRLMLNTIAAAPPSEIHNSSSTSARAFFFDTSSGRGSHSSSGSVVDLR